MALPWKHRAQRLIKDTVLRVWSDRQAAVRAEVVEVERTVAGTRKKLDQLDDAFLFAKTIDIETYDRQRERLRGELTLAQIDRHSSELEEFDIEGVLAFAERVLPRASDMWIQASLDQRQRLQQLFFSEGVRFDGKGCVRTGLTTSAVNWLEDFQPSETSVVDQTGFEPVTS